MKPLFTMTVVASFWVMGLTLPVFSQPAEHAAATQPASNTWHASRSVRIERSANLPPLDAGRLIMLLETSDACRSEANRLVHLPLDKALSLVPVEQSGSIDIVIEIKIPDGSGATPAAAELANFLVAQLRDVVQIETKRLADESIRQAMELVKVRQEAYAEAMAGRNHLHAELSKQTGRVDVSTTGVNAAIARLDDEREATELDLVGLRARREALEATVAKVAKTTEGQMKQDEAAEELKALVAAREKAIATLQRQVQAGTVPAAELENAVAALADAKARLAQRLREVLHSTNAETLATWNHEVLSLAAAENEKRARLEYITRRLEMMKDVPLQLDALERASAVVNKAASALSLASEQLHEMEASARLDHVHITLRESADSQHKNDGSN